MIYKAHETILKFLRDRNWEQYHSPKESSYNTAIEYFELLELFTDISPRESNTILSNQTIGPEVLSELSDVCASLLVLGSHLNIDLKTLEAISSEKVSTKDALTLVFNLGSRIRTLMENFSWISGKLSREMKVHELMIDSFHDTFRAFIRFTNRLGVDPYSSMIKKLDSVAEKYPIELSRDFVFEDGLTIKIKRKLENYQRNQAD